MQLGEKPNIYPIVKIKKNDTMYNTFPMWSQVKA